MNDIFDYLILAAIITVIGILFWHSYLLSSVGRVREEVRQIAVTQQHDFKELKELIAKANDQSEKQHQELIRESSEEMHRIMEKHFAESSNKVDEEWSSLLDNVKKQMNAFINERQIEHDKWLEQIREKTLSTQQKVEMLESAMNQFPESKDLFTEYNQTLQPYLNDKLEEVRMHTAKKLNKASRTLLDYCSVDDWDFALKRHNENLRAGNYLMKEHVEEKLDAERKKLDHLESALGRLSSNPDDHSIVDEIEKIEAELDKRTIERDVVLLNRLRRLTEVMVGHFTRGDEHDERVIKKYNQKAISSFREASRIFRNNEKSYKAGAGLSSITGKMGGWDMNILKPEVQAYYQAVYQEIFGKLDPEVKPEFTERMLNSHQKAV